MKKIITLNDFVDSESNRLAAIPLILTLLTRILFLCPLLSDFLHFVQLLLCHVFRTKKIINFIYFIYL